MKINNFQIGLFTLIGIALFVAALFMLGLYQEFMPKGRFVSLFRESVQGLDVGSPVKFKGVPIGRVSVITIRVKDRLIRVDMEIDLNAFSREKKLSRKQSIKEFYSFFYQEIKSGLRCRLQYAGITGLKYLELDYYKHPNKAPLLNIRPKPRANCSQAYIPSLPSIFSDILGLINTSLEKISKLPLESISAEMKDTIMAAKNLMNSPELKNGLSSFERTSKNFEKTSNTINNTLTEKSLRSLLDEVNKSLTAIEKLVKTTETQVKGAKMIETTESFRGAANSVSEARHSLTNTLLKLDQSLDALTELVNYLNDDPSSLIRGKSRARVIKESKLNKNYAE